MCYSYVMGIGNVIDVLKKDDFLIQKDENNFMVSFPFDKAFIWEKFISEHLKLGYWNEYITENYVVFLFHLHDGIKRYEVYNFENDEVLKICENLCECKFESLKTMLSGNYFYKDKM